MFAAGVAAARVSPTPTQNQKQGVPQRRDMPTAGSITKTIRINPRDLEIIEEIMKDGTTWSGAIHRLCEGVPQIKVERPEYEHRLRQNGAPYGLTGEELALKLLDSMDSGEIVYENGSFRAESKYDFEKFITACGERGVPVQKMIDKCAQMVYQI